MHSVAGTANCVSSTHSSSKTIRKVFITFITTDNTTIEHKCAAQTILFIKIKCCALNSSFQLPSTIHFGFNMPHWTIFYVLTCWIVVRHCLRTIDLFFIFFFSFLSSLPELIPSSSGYYNTYHHCTVSVSFALCSFSLHIFPVNNECYSQKNWRLFSIYKFEYALHIAYAVGEKNRQTAAGMAIN